MKPVSSPVMHDMLRMKGVVSVKQRVALIAKLREDDKVLPVNPRVERSQREVPQQFVRSRREGYESEPEDYEPSVSKMRDRCRSSLPKRMTLTTCINCRSASPSNNQKLLRDVSVNRKRPRCTNHSHKKNCALTTTLQVEFIHQTHSERGT